MRQTEGIKQLVWSQRYSLELRIRSGPRLRFHNDSRESITAYDAKDPNYDFSTFKFVYKRKAWFLQIA